MQSELAGDCTCLDYFGENPDCALHGIATEWALKNTSAAEWQEIASEYRDQGLALRAQQPAASGGVEDVLRGAAVARDRLAPLMKYGEDAVWRPAQFAYEILGNCARTLPTYAQGRKDGIEEAAEIAEQFSTSKWDDRNAIAAAIRALGEPRS